MRKIFNVGIHRYLTISVHVINLKAKVIGIFLLAVQYNKMSSRALLLVFDEN